MQYTHRKMYSLGKNLGEDYIEKGGIKSHKGQYRAGYQNRAGQQGLERDPNTMDINKERGEDRTYFVCGKWGHIAKNYWQRKEREKRIVEILQELAKNNRGQ